MYRFDDEGIEGFPIQLLIIMIVVAIVIPLAWNYVVTYSENETKRDIQQQLAELEIAARDVYTLGHGNARVLELDTNGVFITNVDYIRIGGKPGDGWTNLSSIRYKMNGRSEDVYIIRNPNIPMINLTSIVELSGGVRNVMLESYDESIRNHDIDGDGKLYGRFIEVRLIDM